MARKNRQDLVSARLGLFAILLGAFLLRFAGVARLMRSFFPGQGGTEGAFVAKAIDLYLRFPDLDPKMFDWPPLVQYLAVFAFKLYSLIWVHALALGDARAFALANQADRTWLYFVARMISVCAGTATAAAAYWIARRLYGPKAALVAALFVALAPLHARFSQFAMIDATMTLLTTLGLAGCLMIYEKGRVSDYAATGALIGLGIAAKYLPFLLLVSVFAAHHLGRGRPRSWRPLLLCAALAVATFALASPYSVLRIRSLLDIRWQFAVQSDLRIADKASEAARFLREGLGWPLALLGAAGLAAAARKKPRELVVLGAFPLCVVAFFLCWHPNDYYLLPLVPVLAVFSCEAFLGLSALARDARLAAAALALVFAFPLLDVARYDRMLFRPTTLEEMKGWIDGHLPADAPIVSFINSSDLLLSEFVQEPGSGRIRLYSRYRHLYLRNDRDYDLDDLQRHGEKFMAITDDDTSASSRRLIERVEAKGRLLKIVDADPSRLGPTVRLFAL